MSINKLTIVPVKLDPLPIESITFRSSHDIASPSCVIKTAVAEAKRQEHSSSPTLPYGKFYGKAKEVR